jgi:hypothetical protein
MVLRIVLHKFKGCVCIDHHEDANFPVDPFLLCLQEESGVKVLSKKNIFSSFGPLGYADQYSTSWGDMRIEIQIEEVQYCVQISTQSEKLLHGVIGTLENPALYTVCDSYQDLSA